MGQTNLWMQMIQYLVRPLLPLLSLHNTNFYNQATTSMHPSLNVDSNNEPISQSTHTSLADTQHAARVPLPPPTFFFAQPSVDVSKDAETGSLVVIVHPEADADARPEPGPGPEPESASASGVGAGGFGAIGGTQATSKGKTTA